MPLERTPTGITFHLAPEPAWRACQGEAVYVPERFAQDQFTHCTDGEANAIDVGNRYYRDDRRPYLLLDIDLTRVQAPAIYEDDGCRYPHNYGPIDRAAVVRVRCMQRSADGSFAAIGDPLEF